jgi:deoxyribodipyrimidine photo-lyase
MDGRLTALVWFRRDLRVHDHPALLTALERHDEILPVFCFDDRLLHGRHASGTRTQFLLECLADLNGALEKRGGGLVLRHGAPERELTTLAQEVGATEIHHTYDVSPFDRARSKRVAPALAAEGIELVEHPGFTAVDDVRTLRTQAGGPYTVFSPFYRTWQAAARRDVAAAPRSVPIPAKVARGRLPSLESLGLTVEVEDPLHGGESEGRRRLARFLRSSVRGYESSHDALGDDGTSRLSAYLRFGCLSPAEVEARLPRGNGAEAFRRQLCWRDFYAQVLHAFPGNAHSEFQERYRHKLDWNSSPGDFEAWTEGRTGFPLVDAGMRQLRREGFMHNRARLVVGSFLTKDLGIDWRRGERWFMRMLLDGDEANNNGNWQWIASVGVDPQPAFRRIYNPKLQMERHDPDGKYVRRYVPELAAVPDEYLGEPWTMPPEVQEKARCVIGIDYPQPIVDHAEARREALARFGAAA